MINIEDKIKGSINEDDAATQSERMFLYALVRAIKPGVCVEIGTHRGLSSLYIAQALHDNQRGVLHTTDPIDYEQKTNFDKFPALRERIKVYYKKGEELEVEGKVDFLFVDGYHEENYVLAELKNFLPKLSDRAVVVFHDTGGDNVQVGVNSAIAKYNLKTAFIPTDNTMRIYGHFNPNSVN